MGVNGFQSLCKVDIKDIQFYHGTMEKKQLRNCFKLLAVIWKPVKNGISAFMRKERWTPIFTYNRAELLISDSNFSFDSLVGN